MERCDQFAPAGNAITWSIDSRMPIRSPDGTRPLVKIQPAQVVKIRPAPTERDELLRQPDEKLPTVDQVMARYRENLLRLTEALTTDVERARAALSQALGPITLENRGTEVWATLETKPAAMLLAAGTLGLVAGEGFEPSTFGL